MAEPGAWRTVSLAEDDLILRPWRTGDQELMGTTIHAPEIARYFGRRLDVPDGEPLPEDPDAPMFAITEGGAVVGVIWFGRGIRPFEVGYYLHPAACGRGVATRSLKLVTDWMLDGLNQECVVLHTHPENARSQAVALRAGYSPDGEVARYAAFKDGTTRALRYRAAKQ